MQKVYAFAGVAFLLVSCGGGGVKTKGPETVQVTAKASAPVDPKEIQIQQILATAAFYFERGETEFRDGHLEKARHDFDTCVDTFLLSGFDPGQDPRLSSALDNYLTEIHNRELVAFKDGDGFTEAPLEPATIDELEVPVEEPPTAAETDELIEKIEGDIAQSDYDIPVVINSKVLAFISSFQNRRRDEIEGGLWRSGRYLPMIRQILKEEGVPQDLAYVALIESSFKPNAYSRAAAMGMWQFILGTGQRYKMKTDWWVDERRDPEKATRAAAHYLRDLYNMFGDWYLAMAGYNAGERKVAYALQRTGKKTFWEIAETSYLRIETKNYVPAILAGMLIAKNQEEYGFAIEPDKPIEYESIRVPTTSDLRLIAECADSTLSEIQALNPELRRLTTPKGVTDYALRVPAGRTELFAANFALIPPDKRVTWRLRTVEAGDTLTKLASLFGTSVTSILQANALEKPEVATGSKLIIPMGPKLIAQAGSTSYSSGRVATTSTSGSTYTVRSGDTIFSIARLFDLSPTSLMQKNGLRSALIHPGDRLVVRSSTSSGSQSGSYEKVVYQVKKGDTLFEIASHHNTTVESIRGLNGLSRSRVIYPGEKLVIYRGKK
ncbi:MAG: LysM peptidoglycan-binding domain-containing protein [Acidobacteria bacterium]|nr:LysM peptidoglycan-binding domain-containing protein [Acidobacteriota bacterium]